MQNAVLFATLVAFLPAVAQACAPGAKCISVGDAQIVSASLADSPDTTGARFLKAPEPVAPTVPLALAAGQPLQVAPLYEPGDILPRGRYSMLMNSDYHGLPPAPEGTLYFEVDLKVLLVDIASYEVLQDVSREVAATF